MKKQLKVAIILTTYNSCEYLVELLESIYAQTYDNWQIYASDDGSSDNTVNILKSYMKERGKLIYIANKNNVGVGRNFGRALSLINDEELVAECDSDDIWLNTKLEKQVKHMQSSNSILSHHNATLVDESGNPLGKDLWAKLQCSGNETQISQLLNKNVVTGPTIMYWARLNKYFVPVPEGVVQDYWAALIASMTGGISKINEELICYRQHSGSLQGAMNNGLGFYVKNVFSSSYRRKYAKYCRDNIIILTRLNDFAGTKYEHELLINRFNYYVCLDTYLSAKSTLNSSGLLIKCVKAAIISKDNRLKFITFFFAVNKIVGRFS